ncbi:MAG: low molecular weight phosphotyrosine protein phosphatase [Frankiales bacterium]|nr:low molecular weight phosphotyrosine protein phosphatase [Frankiales bacterium]
MTRVCFVCLGNICRSPIAEVVLRRLLLSTDLDVEVSSAGTGDWHVGRPADDRAQAALRRHGYDGSGHIARQFDPAEFADLDLVVAMDRSNLRDLRRMSPPDALARIRLLSSFDSDAVDEDVPDPYYGGSDGVDDVVALVERGCRGLVAELQRQRDTPDA